MSYLARTRDIDRIVPLDDFDVETAAALREHLRMPGMGDTTARYFRDKLAMRVKARDHGILVPEFVHVLNHERIHEFTRTASRRRGCSSRAPRRRRSASRRSASADELWPALEALGDRQSFYLLEQFVPGDIFHVDSIVSEREVVFAATHKYGQPPMEVAHEGGVFMTRTVPRSTADAQALEALNRDLITTLGLVRGVTHTEFIKGRDDGRFYFLETAARVGGANIAEVVEAATGVNLWAEWAKIEIAGERGSYEAAAAPRRLRRHRHLARAAGDARHLRLRRPRDRLAPPQATPRRPHRRLAQSGARRAPARGLRPPLLHGLLRLDAFARQADELKLGVTRGNAGEEGEKGEENSVVFSRSVPLCPFLRPFRLLPPLTFPPLLLLFKQRLQMTVDRVGHDLRALRRSGERGHPG